MATRRLKLYVLVDVPAAVPEHVSSQFAADALQHVLSDNIPELNPMVLTQDQ